MTDETQTDLEDKLDQLREADAEYTYPIQLSRDRYPVCKECGGSQHVEKTAYCGYCGLLDRSHGICVPVEDYED